ncbi:TPA: response regulator transcription factor [bacterium]|nr:response regulator transcription factor [bacterium]
MSSLIAIVDDEEDITQLLSIHLTNAGFLVESFMDGESFLRYVELHVPALIILDLMLPDTDGLDICKYLKNHDYLSSIPIIILSAKSDEIDRVIGLELGADDYITKPFSSRELVARVKAVLRRKSHDSESKKTIIGDILVIDFEKPEVIICGNKINLTPTELGILELLSSKKGWVYTRDQILNHLWEEEKIINSRTIDVHIRNLREKLGEASKFLKSVRGIGYKIEEK